jgi:hypothetical protein
LKELPGELISDIASYLDKKDLLNMRLVNKKMCGAMSYVFKVAIADNRTIFPRYVSLAAFFLLLNSEPCLSLLVRSVTLVEEGLKEHEYGHNWAWERKGDMEGLCMTRDDFNILNQIEVEHLQARDLDQSFINGGGYRVMLGKYHPAP